MSGSKRFFCVPSLLLCRLLAVSAAIGQGAVDPIPIHVDNTVAPSPRVEKIGLKEEWRIGGENTAFIFRSIDKVLLGHDGRLYILDGRAGLIYVNSLEDGSGLTTINIDGDGPGELRFAHDMFLVDEDRIALLRSYPAQIAFIDYQGDPKEGVDLSGFPAFQAGPGSWRDDALVISCVGTEEGDRRTCIARFGPHGEEVRYADYPTRSSRKLRRMYEEDFYFVSMKPWAIGPDRTLYVCPYWSQPDRGCYQINSYDGDGRLQCVITREFDAYERSRAEKIEVAYRMFGGKELYERLIDSGFEYLVEDYEADVLEIVAHPDGNLWVLTSRGVHDREPGMLVSFDVFSTDGKYLNQVSLLGEGDGLKDEICFLDQSRVVVVKGQSELRNGGPIEAQTELSEIICYSVE